MAALVLISLLGVVESVVEHPIGTGTWIGYGRETMELSMLLMLSILLFSHSHHDDLEQTKGKE
jgi:hypothetical protein